MVGDQLRHQAPRRQRPLLQPDDRRRGHLHDHVDRHRRWWRPQPQGHRDDQRCRLEARTGHHSVSQSFVIVPQQMLTFDGTFSDAGSGVDPAPGYQVTWAWGDNSPNTTGGTGYLRQQPHTYTASGTYTVTLTVKDDDLVAGSATTTITVLTPEAALAKVTTFVQGVSGLNAGQRNSLLAKLNAANDSLQRVNYNAAC